MIPVEKLTEQARQALGRSQELLVKLRHNALDSEHLLLILLGQREGLVPLALKHLDASPAPMLERLQRDLAARPATPEWQLAVHHQPRERGCSSARWRTPTAVATSSSAPSTCCWRRIATRVDPATKLFASHRPRP